MPGISLMLWTFALLVPAGMPNSWLRCDQEIAHSCTPGAQSGAAMRVSAQPTLNSIANVTNDGTQLTQRTFDQDDVSVRESLVRKGMPL